MSIPVTENFEFNLGNAVRPLPAMVSVERAMLVVPWVIVEKDGTQVPAAIVDRDSLARLRECAIALGEQVLLQQEEDRDGDWMMRLAANLERREEAVYALKPTDIDPLFQENLL